jgi:quercetin dioxygenase-like cupin family protein
MASTMMGTVEPTGRVLLTTGDIEHLPWEDLHGTTGVRTKVLWRAGTSLAGLLTFDAGAALPAHTHEDGHHHVYVESGQCRVSGQLLAEGGYAHIPAGQAHDLAAGGDEGCVLLYLYLGT